MSKHPWHAQQLQANELPLTQDRALSFRFYRVRAVAAARWLTKRLVHS
jgi:hypothetical protein